jgi:hypothetical protein
VERGIEGSLFDPQLIAGDPVDVFGDGVPVGPALDREGPEDQQGEGALENVVALAGHRFTYLAIYS